MKRLLLIAGMIIAHALMIAAPVSQAVVFTVAENWIEMKSNSICSISNYVIVSDSLSTPLYYKIDFQPQGFVIVAADDSSIPILGYSVTGSILGSSNPARESMLNEYSSQVTDIKSNNRSNSETSAIWASIINGTATTIAHHDINLSTDWHQSAPYNNLCPLNNPGGSRSVVGCVATATAQIINYHKLWEHVFTDADDYSYPDINPQYCVDDMASSLAFPTFTSLNTNMENVVYNFRHDIPLTSTDIQALCFGTGVLEEMSYSSTASSAYTYNDAYRAFQELNYSCLRDTKTVNNNGTWIPRIVQDIDADRPIQYRGTDHLGGNGHSFILCGYQTNNVGTTEFLVNWGWGSSYNGEYYTLDALNPSNYNFSFNHQMIYNIRPNIILRQQIALSDASTNYSGITLSLEDTHGDVQMYHPNSNGLFNIELPETGMCKIDIYDANGNYIPIEDDYFEIFKGTNRISNSTITLQRLIGQHIVIVPTHAPTIQAAIDMVANGGIVSIVDGSYNVSRLRWVGKHIRLQGQSANGVILTTSYDSYYSAIELDWAGINNQDVISNITFSECDLIGHGERRGAAIALLNGASPIINNCVFTANRVGMPYNFDDPMYSGVGGAVFIEGDGNQTSTPVFYNCNFTNNRTIYGNGGGAVGLSGAATFNACTFTGNYNGISTGFNPPPCINAGGAILIYMPNYPGEIRFRDCQFADNKGMYEADDVFVCNTDQLDILEFEGCTFSTCIPSYSSLSSIKFLKDTQANVYSNDMNTHLIMKDNKFLSSHNGAVYFCDYKGRNSVTFSNNIVANNMYPGYGFYLRYHEGPPANPNYFVFNNNTLSNINGSGLVLFEGSTYTVNNNVFDNCSSYGINWGSYEEGGAGWVTTGLTVNNCIFSSTSPRYDFFGSTSFPLVQNSVSDVETFYLDNNYRPLWNTNGKSPCIDSGNPDMNGNGIPWYDDYQDIDADGTQLDIGAIPLLDGHRQAIHKLSNDKYRYISFPGVINYPGSGDQNLLSDIINPLLGNPVTLERITWQYNHDKDEITPYYVPDHHVCSQNGYKVQLVFDDYFEELIHYTGYLPDTSLNYGMFQSDLNRYTPKHYIIPPEENDPSCSFDPNTGVLNREIYLGYYLDESLKPFDALAPILNDITTILAEDWAMVRLPVPLYQPQPGDEPSDAYTDDWLGCVTSGSDIAINPGQMVVVKYIGTSPVEFKLGGDNPTPPYADAYYREMASQFSYDEQSEYIPIFVSIDLNQFENGNKPTEIAVFVDEECKGAAVIKEGEVQLNAYITNITDPSEELKSMEFRMYFPGKAASTNVLSYSVLNPQSGAFESRRVKLGECKGFLQVKIGATEIPPLPLTTRLYQNYPNPFNPETSIKYDLKEDGQVLIDIYNLKGQKVRSLVNNVKNAGSYTESWNGTDNNGKQVSSGVYFFRMHTHNQTLTNKMLLMK